jgi:cytochrome c biogenesis protein CcdA
VTSTLLEAVRATTQPCTFLLLAPSLLTVVVVRARWWAVAATFAAAIVGGWMLAWNAFVLDGTLLQVSGAAVAATIALAAVASFREQLAWANSRAAGAVIAGGVTVAASLWWRPCVGLELGRLLTRAQTDPVRQFPGMAVYMVGAVIPVLVVALAMHAIAAPDCVTRSVSVVAAGTVSVIAIAVMLGRHDAVVVTLTEWTQS